MIFIGYQYLNKDIIWRKIYWKNGEITKYSISNIGLVRNDDKNKILKTNFSKGYERLNLTHNGKQKQFFVHRLVATAFIPNPENRPEVNHINGDKKCNYDYNLEWSTHSENIIHAFETGLNSCHKHFSKTDKKKIKKVCKLLEKNELSISQIANKIGVSRQVVGRIQKRLSYIDISSDYNISNYKIKTSFSKSGDYNERTKYSDKDIIEVCELIDSGYTLPSIAKITKVPYQTIRNVYYGSCRKSVSEKYNFMKNRNK